MVILLLGGSASGKSQWAEGLAVALHRRSGSVRKNLVAHQNQVLCLAAEMLQAQADRPLPAAFRRKHLVCNQVPQVLHQDGGTRGEGQLHQRGSQAVLDELGLAPIIIAGLCLGEGTGAVTMMPMLDMAAAVYRKMSTFAEIHMEWAAIWQMLACPLVMFSATRAVISCPVWVTPWATTPLSARPDAGGGMGLPPAGRRGNGHRQHHHPHRHPAGGGPQVEAGHGRQVEAPYLGQNVHRVGGEAVGMVILLLGGSASGKSQWAEGL